MDSLHGTDKDDRVIDIVFNRNGCEKVYEMNKSIITIGRAHHCDISVPQSVYLSKHHCTVKVIKSSQEVMLDVMSGNGLLINKNKHGKGETINLTADDVIYLVHRKDELESDISFTFKTYFNGNCTEDTEDSETTDNTLEYDIDDEYVQDFEVEKKSLKRIALYSSSDEPVSKLKRNDSDCVPKEFCSTEQKKDKALEENLICLICQDIYHECVSCQPCLHSFCGGCFSDWKGQSSQCPTCREEVKSVRKNHALNNLSSAYLEMHPEKKRSNEEIAELDKKCEKLGELMVKKQVYADYSSSDSSSDDDIHISLPHYVVTPPRCRECPSQTGSSSASTTIARVCGVNDVHLVCSCCRELLPSSTNNSNKQCTFCRLYYCHQYWGCRKIDCLGCLNRFKDLNFNDSALSGLIQNNTYESDILKTYFTQKNINIRDFLNICVSKLLDGSYTVSTNNTFTGDTMICYRCGLLYLRELAYQYRRDIPSTELPAEVTSRADCHWGRSCRTQGHSPHHARRLNHICEQTRFR